MSFLIKEETVTLPHSGATVTVKTPGGWLVTDSQQIMYLAVKWTLHDGEDVEEFNIPNTLIHNRLSWYAEMIIATVSVEGFDFEFPTLTKSTNEEIGRGMAFLSEIHPEDVQAWQEALDRVTQPPGDPDLAPDSAGGNE
jgi:hypothetical protein